MTEEATRNGYTLTGESAGFLEAVEDAVDDMLGDAFTVVADEGPEELQAWADRMKQSTYLQTPAPVRGRYGIHRHHLAFQTAFSAVCAYLNIPGTEPTPAELAWVVLLELDRPPRRSPDDSVSYVRAVFRGMI